MFPVSHDTCEFNAPNVSVSTVDPNRTAPFGGGTPARREDGLL
ncbi:hypothetical protein C486_04049 [Natrinema gari JCM 14663]|uniref:Uncharacterized protein n=1 Tax=Natrinema gari JCM 14663 TaxID=1230459 RepID=L9Z9I6_9EURY|nr:hypothetical protein C486_04049 [Natrinema gari JCM 14663]